MTGGWVDFLLSEAILARLRVLDPRIIGNVARVKPPITGIIRSSLQVNFLIVMQHILLEFSSRDCRA